MQHSEQILMSFPGGAAYASPMAVDRTFEELFVEHYPRLVRTLVRLTGNSGQAEELAADAFYKLYQNPAQTNPAGWLYRTAINLGLDALRANARRLRREEKAGQPPVEPETALAGLLAEEQRGRVRAVLARMKPEHGQALLMGSSGFTSREMAQVLGMKTESLYVLVGRAKAKFEQEYTKIYGRQQ